MRYAPGAWRLAAIPLLLGAALALFASPLGLLGVAAAGFVLWFHRDPERTTPAEGLVAPADGRVTVLRAEDDRVRVGVFMGVTDVHVNRAPVDGTVEAVTHEPGAHRPAFSKDSDRNERVRLELGDTEVTLIAGAFARRIHPYVAAGDVVARGERIGHISFGSRVDVLLPPGVEMADIRVTEGERVRAGETVLVGPGDW